MSTNTKPLAEWTLGDIKKHCTKEGDCKNPTVCRFFNSEEGGCSISHDTPNLWDLTEKPRFTKDEVAFMRALEQAAPEAIIQRDECDMLFWHKPSERADKHTHLLPHKLFPSIRPGQSITIADIIGKGDGAV